MAQNPIAQGQIANGAPGPAVPNPRQGGGNAQPPRGGRGGGGGRGPPRGAGGNRRQNPAQADGGAGDGGAARNNGNRAGRPRQGAARAGPGGAGVKKQIPRLELRQIGHRTDFPRLNGRMRLIEPNTAIAAEFRPMDLIVYGPGYSELDNGYSLPPAIGKFGVEQYVCSQEGRMPPADVTYTTWWFKPFEDEPEVANGLDEPTVQVITNRRPDAGYDYRRDIPLAPFDAHRVMNLGYMDMYAPPGYSGPMRGGPVDNSRAAIKVFYIESRADVPVSNPLVIVTSKPEPRIQKTVDVTFTGMLRGAGSDFVDISTLVPQQEPVVEL